MLHKLYFKKKFRNFEEGTVVEFRPGVNLLVGDQGSGKSSLLQAIAASCKAKKFQYPYGLEKDVDYEATPMVSGGFDFEKQNLRTLSYFESNAAFQVGSMFRSHGESNMAILRTLNNSQNTLLFLDEPDMALSLRSIMELIAIFKKAASRSCQIIAAVHHPFVIWAFPEVLSCEHRKWMDSKEFVRLETETNASTAT